MRILAICNQKGGVGKTTTAVNLAACLSEQGFRVLAIDLDHQCNLGMYVGHTADDLPTIADLIFAVATGATASGAVSAPVIRHAPCGIDYIPASLRLAKADIILAQAMCRERILSSLLSRLPVQDYDYCIIDCSPQMGVLLHNALYAADGVLIPVQTEDFSMEGLDDMLGLIDMIRASGKQLQIMGILPTMVTANTVSRSIVTKLQERFGELCFTGIRRSVDAAKSAAAKTPLTATKSKLAEQYRVATQELLCTINK